MPLESTMKRMQLPQRLIPLLALFLLFFSVSYISGFVHETGHGLLALAQGGTFTGIIIEQGRWEASANSPLVSIGGWLGQYALAVAILLLVRKFNPVSFTARSVALLLILSNLLSPPAYMASLYGDSQGFLEVLTAYIGLAASIAVIEGAAAALTVAGMYVCWRISRQYFSNVFPWMTSKRFNFAGLILTALYTLFVYIGYSGFRFGLPGLSSESFVGIILFITLLVIFSFFVIPSVPISYQNKVIGPTSKSLALIVLLFILTQVIYFSILPYAAITIPFSDIGLSA